LKSIYDLERLGSRISVGVANGRGPRRAPDIHSGPAGSPERPFRSEAARLRAIHKGIDELRDVVELIERAIVDEPPMSIREGGSSGGL
jgi:DNA mismatch repair protein MutS